MMRAITQEYINNPNHCLHCGEKILPKKGWKLRQIKKKKFCNRQCSGLYSTAERKAERLKISRMGVCARYGENYEAKIVPCVVCGENTNIGVKNHRKFCKKCWGIEKDRTSNIMKKDSTHPKIRSHARIIANVAVNNSCIYCRYERYVEVCHIKPVRDFSDESLLSEINHPDNLIVLCRNHHWELDHGVLDLDEIRSQKLDAPFIPL